MDDLLAAWKAFVAGLPAGAGVRPLIVASWERSRTAGVEPAAEAPRYRRVPGAELARRLQVSADLLTAARPHLAWLAAALADAPHVVYLVDADGIVLESAASDPSLAEAWGLQPGHDWSEAAMGTNGAGTAIAAGQPVAVVGGEHYQQAFHGAT